MLETIYQSADMGIKGIDDILYKIKSPKLFNIIKKERKEYQKILKETKKLAKQNDIKLNDIGMMAKLSSEIISNIKIMMKETETEIIKMMIEGTYKSLGLLNGKLLEEKDDEVKKIGRKFITMLEDNIKELKNI